MLYKLMEEYLLSKFQYSGLISQKISCRIFKVSEFEENNFILV